MYYKIYPPQWILMLPHLALALITTNSWRILRSSGFIMASWILCPWAKSWKLLHFTCTVCSRRMKRHAKLQMMWSPWSSRRLTNQWLTVTWRTLTNKFRVLLTKFLRHLACDPEDLKVTQKILKDLEKNFVCKGMLPSPYSWTFVFYSPELDTNSCWSKMTWGTGPKVCDMKTLHFSITNFF